MVECIIYTSSSGHTKKYVDQLAETLNIPAYTIKAAKKKNLKSASILYVSWILEDKLVGWSKLSKYSIVGVVGVGILPNKLERNAKIKEHNFLTCPFFYLRGGIKKKKLSFMNKWKLKMIANHISYKVLDKRATMEEMEVLDAILNDLDYSNLKDMEKIISWAIGDAPSEMIM